MCTTKLKKREIKNHLAWPGRTLKSRMCSELFSGPSGNMATVMLHSMGGRTWLTRALFYYRARSQTSPTPGRSAWPCPGQKRSKNSR